MQGRVARAGEVLNTGVGLVGELEVGLGALKSGFLLIDHFHARAHQDVGELGLCDINAGLGLTQFRDKLGVVDLEQQLPGGDVLAPLDGTLADAPIHPRGNVDAGRIRFALDDERLRPCEIPDREADNRGKDERYDSAGSRRASLWPFALRFGFGSIFRRCVLFHVCHTRLISEPEAHQAPRRGSWRGLCRCLAASRFLGW